jgi:ABC-type branched-subunit amino acid transport system permease subunit
VGIGRLSFVAWLFVMAIASLVLAGTNKSLGWLVSGIVLLCVATYAMRQFKKEAETEPEGVSISFFGVAIVIMLVVMLGLFWLQSSG